MCFFVLQKRTCWTSTNQKAYFLYSKVYFIWFVKIANDVHFCGVIWMYHMQICKIVRFQIIDPWCTPIIRNQASSSYDPQHISLPSGWYQKMLQFGVNNPQCLRIPVGTIPRNRVISNLRPLTPLTLPGTGNITKLQCWLLQNRLISTIAKSPCFRFCKIAQFSLLRNHQIS
jgi:hypothetical protein